MHLAIILAKNIVACTLVISAAVLAFQQVDGWGWFLFVAFLMLTGSTAVETVTGNSNASSKASKKSDA